MTTKTCKEKEEKERLSRCAPIGGKKHLPVIGGLETLFVFFALFVLFVAFVVRNPG